MIGSSQSVKNPHRDEENEEREKRRRACAKTNHGADRVNSRYCRDDQERSTRNDQLYVQLETDDSMPNDHV